MAYALAAIVVRLVFGGVPARLGSYRVARGALVLYAGVVFALALVGPRWLELWAASSGSRTGFSIRRSTRSRSRPCARTSADG